MNQKTTTEFYHRAQVGSRRQSLVPDKLASNTSWKKYVPFDDVEMHRYPSTRISTIAAADVSPSTRNSYPRRRCCDGRPRGPLRQSGIDDPWSIFIRRVRPTGHQMSVGSNTRIDGGSSFGDEGSNVDVKSKDDIIAVAQRRKFLPIIEPIFHRHTDVETIQLESALKNKLSSLNTFQPVSSFKSKYVNCAGINNFLSNSNWFNIFNSSMRECFDAW